MAAKTLTCECGANCGEMREGRFRKGAVILCPKCIKQYQTLKMIYDARLAQGGIDKWKDLFGENSEFEDLFKGMFK